MGSVSAVEAAPATETAAPTQEAAPKPDAAYEATIASVLGKHGLGDKEPEPAPETKQETPPAEAVKEQPEEAPAKEAPSAASESETETESGESDGYAKALAALRLSGLPESAINAMTRRQVLKWGRTEAKRNADRDETLRERADLRKKLETTPKPETTTQTERAEPTVALDFKTLAKPVVKTFEELGIDAPVAEKALEEFARGVMSPLQQELAEQRKATANLMEGFEALILNDARKGLVDQFPQLSDDAAFAEVVSEVTERVNASKGKYGIGDIPKLMQKSAFYLFQDEIESKARETKAVTNTKRDASQVTTKSRVPSPKGLSKEEADTAEITDVLKRHGLG